MRSPLGFHPTTVSDIDWAVRAEAAERALDDARKRIWGLETHIKALEVALAAAQERIEQLETNTSCPCSTCGKPVDTWWACPVKGCKFRSANCAECPPSQAMIKHIEEHRHE